MSKTLNAESTPSLLVTPREYFTEVVSEAVESRKLKTKPLVENYLVGLLSHYMLTDNLFEINEKTGGRANETMAELYLKACQSEKPLRHKMLKRIADMTLYIGGYFGDSLKKKIIDVDYYADIGGSAYGILASEQQEDFSRKVYGEFSKKIVQYMDVLTIVSQKSRLQNNTDVLRLYDLYISTGSGLAKDQLNKLGLLNSQIKKHLKQ